MSTTPSAAPKTMLPHDTTSRTPTTPPPLRILILGCFMRHAAPDFSSHHHIHHWAKRGGSQPNPIAKHNTLRRLWNPRQIDIVVCNAFGRSYGFGRSKTKSRLLLLAKAVAEHFWISALLRLMRTKPIPFALVDNSDDLTLDPHNLRLAMAATRIFKRELPWDPFLVFEGARGILYHQSANRTRSTPRYQSIAERLSPLCLSTRGALPPTILTTSPPWHDRDIDLFFSGDIQNKPLRNTVRNSCRLLADKGFTVYFPDHALPVDTYYTTLQRTKLALSPPGLGWDCHRHYEAAAAGAIPVMPYPWIRQMHPFMHKKSALYYDPGLDLAETLIHWLRQPEGLPTIGATARAHVLEHCTHAKIFEHLLQETLHSAPHPSPDSCLV